MDLLESIFYSAMGGLLQPRKPWAPYANQLWGEHETEIKGWIQRAISGKLLGVGTLEGLEYIESSLVSLHRAARKVNAARSGKKAREGLTEVAKIKETMLNRVPGIRGFFNAASRSMLGDFPCYWDGLYLPFGAFEVWPFQEIDRIWAVALDQIESQGFGVGGFSVMGTVDQTCFDNFLKVVKEKIAQKAQEAKNTLEVGHTYESDVLRVHRFREALQVFDLTNAGKRGKAVDQLSLSYRWQPEEWADGLMPRILSGLPYNTIHDYLKAHADAEPNVTMTTHQHKGVHIKPPGFQTIEIRTPRIHLVAGFDNFTVQDVSDTANLPTCYSTDSAKRSIPKFYKWVKENRAEIQAMRYSEVEAHMDRLGIESRFYCAVD